MAEQERRRIEHMKATGQTPESMGSSGKPSPVPSEGASKDGGRDRSGERPPSHGRHSAGPPTQPGTPNMDRRAQGHPGKAL